MKKKLVSILLGAAMVVATQRNLRRKTLQRRRNLRIQRRQKRRILPTLPENLHTGPIRTVQIIW